MSVLDELPLSRKQIVSIIESRRHRVSIWAGAVRSGKTIASILAFYDAIVHAPDTGLIVVVGRTLQTIERNIIEPMQDEMVFGEWAHEVHHTRGSNTAVILGRTVHLIGASDVRAEGKLRGLTACLALVDEATLLPENFWTQLLARLSVPGARCLATTNPDNPNHYLKVNFIDRAGESGMNLGAWHFTLDDNPSLAPEYVAAIKAEFTGLFYLRNILGRWVAADGAIFDMFDPDKHVVPWSELPDMRWILGVGVDHGTTNPTHAVMIGHGSDDVLYCMDEWRYKASNAEARKTNVQLSAGLREWLNKAHHPSEDPENPEGFRGYVIADQSAADFRVQLKQDGLPTHPAKKDVLYGIRTMTALVASGRLKFSDRCPELIKEIPGYVWDTKATEKGKDEPIKLNDHGIDSARYLLTTAERKWRRQIKLNELPLSVEPEPVEPRLVKRVMS
ncbi:PBSX family phage terminase large subunit [Nocardia flavorosea]|uniref:PBSX family phage terminase large subunit n=1 Tax=Nocardia flavorosea TaxID=53429 RepID=A0A846YL51_9NOCA|nr:PBSX family phage terminase large subunit [Nocardia flavorosea]NKY60366.1 PBSX family phage terminase large subunit [Nocardia flavorosea]